MKTIENTAKSEKAQAILGSNETTKPSKASFCKISKPLIILKLALFSWFSAGAALTPFMNLYLKQLGLTTENLSIILIVLPIVQFMGPTISGVIADKIGKSKPVLQANLFLVIIVTTSMLFIPQLQNKHCSFIHCELKDIEDNQTLSICNIQGNDSLRFNCSFHCSFGEKYEDFCFQNYISTCDVLEKHSIFINISKYKTNYRDDKYLDCLNNVDLYNSSIDNSWCPNHVVGNCRSTCASESNFTNDLNSCESVEGQKEFFIICCALMFAYHTFFSICHRIIDVTAMTMIKTHHSDFGRERFWSVLGIMVFSPLSAYVVSLASPEEGFKRYDIAFYIFNGMSVLTMAIVWKLDVKMEPPGKNMLKKVAQLLKNFDVLVFLITIFFIGSAWGFTKLFTNWYLDELNAPSILMGIIPAVNSLVGLPFLFTSKWFVDKIGSANLLLLALLGFVGLCTGYSFLENPWWSIIYEIFGIVTQHLFWVAVVTHIYAVAPMGLTATAMATAGGIHFGIGKGSGSLIGGMAMSKFGGRVAFRVMAGVCLGAAAFYLFYLLIRRRFNKKEMDLRKIEFQTPVDCFEEKFTTQM